MRSMRSARGLAALFVFGFTACGVAADPEGDEDMQSGPDMPGDMSGDLAADMSEDMPAGRVVCGMNEHTCAANAKCNRNASKPSGWECLCNTPGYLGDGEDTCEDEDECARTTNRVCTAPGNICVNEPGTFRCDCAPGYEKDSTGNGCKDINECAPGGIAQMAGCEGTCENTSGGYNCFGKGGISSLEDPDNSPYPNLQCAGSFPEDKVYFQTNKTKLIVDCRCAQGASADGAQHCSAPGGSAEEGDRIGAGISMADHPNREMNGCATSVAENTVFFGVKWGDSRDSGRSYIMAIDPANGNRRIVSGTHLDAGGAVTTKGAGAHFDEIRDLALGPDGMLYVFEQSIGNAALPDDQFPLFQGRSIYKVDPATGDRTLVWNHRGRDHMNVLNPAFGRCKNGKTVPVDDVQEHVDIDLHQFELDEQGNFFLSVRPNANPPSPHGFVRISKDGATCDWITRGNINAGISLTELGTGPMPQGGFDRGFGYRDGKILATEFINNGTVTEIDVATGDRRVLWKDRSPKVGNGPGAGTWAFVWSDRFDAWITAGNPPTNPTAFGFLKINAEGVADTHKWSYTKPSGAITDEDGSTNYGYGAWNAPYMTNMLNGPIRGLKGEGHKKGAVCHHPTDPEYMFTVSDSSGIILMELSTGNTIVHSM